MPTGMQRAETAPPMRKRLFRVTVWYATGSNRSSRKHGAGFERRDVLNLTVLQRGARELQFLRGGVRS